ncbi:MAG: hypothetical protein K0R38_3598 [Polyangiaceae bacterium]|nr:hypothetical protein [Polyangiaceae bacterium]
MSGFPPASAASRSRLWRARLLALCGGLAWAGPAFAQMPAWAAEDEGPPVEPPLAAPAPLPEPAPAPPSAPDAASLQSELTPRLKEASSEPTSS